MTTRITILHNNSAVKSINVLVNDTIFPNLSYGEYTSSELNTKILNFSIKSGNVIVHKNTFKLKNFGCYTFLINGDANTISISSYEDSERFDSSSGYLKIIHGAYGVGGVNILTKVKDQNDDFKQIITNLQYDQSSSGLILKPYQSYDIKIILYQSGETILEANDFRVPAGSLYKVVATLDNGIPKLIVLKLRNVEKLKSNFDISKYMGRWYLIASYPEPYLSGCKYSIAEYLLLSDKVKVVNKCYDQFKNFVRSEEGTATSKCGTAELTVTFPGKESNYPNYIVHKTDYTGYAIVGSPFRTSLFILGRMDKMTKMNYDRITSYVETLGYDKSKLQKMN